MKRRSIYAVLLTGALAASLAGGVTAEASVQPTASAHTPSSTTATPVRPPTPDVAELVAEAKAAGITPYCGCQNVQFVKYAMQELGVRHLKLKEFQAVLGKSLGRFTYNTMTATLSNKTPTLQQDIPFPNKNAASAKKYRKSLYNVYQIFYEWRGPEYNSSEWKFGITRQAVPAERPQRQIPACNTWRKKHEPGSWRCNWVWEYQNVHGWFLARTYEADLALQYADLHGGHCPPGMPACV